MKIELVDSCVGKGVGQQFLMSLVVNEAVAFDAGCIGYLSPVEDQREITHVFLSHSHLDHIASLPIFLDNVYQPGPECPTVYATPSVWKCLRGDFFNERVWPDLVRLSQEETPFFTMMMLSPGSPVIIDDLVITPIPIDHVVPNVGFIVEDSDSAVGIILDTSPTDKIWEELNRRENLKAVFLEATFPNSMGWLAEKAKHLTPMLVRSEIQKLHKSVPVIAFHMKPVFQKTIVAELHALALPNLEISEPGKTYSF
jgi:ribonuclease BN (tRNA processing enzyme)